MNKKANQKQVIKSKKAEANARRKVNKSWEKMEHTPRYRSTSAKEVCDTITKKIEIELLDGILLNLSIKSQTKPSSVQNRILRRIVEKRQAQANHKKYGRTEDLAAVLVIENISKRRLNAAEHTPADGMEEVDILRLRIDGNALHFHRERPLVRRRVHELRHHIDTHGLH